MVRNFVLIVIAMLTSSASFALGVQDWQVLFKKLDAFMPAVEGKATIKLTDLQNMLGLQGHGLPVDSDGSMHMPGITSRYKRLHFDEIILGTIRAESMVVEVDRRSEPVVQRLWFDLAEQECIDSAPIISKYKLNSSVLPDSGPGALEVRYERKIGFGVIWLNAKSKNDPSHTSCATEMGFVFGAGDAR